MANLSILVSIGSLGCIVGLDAATESDTATARRWLQQNLAAIEAEVVGALRAAAG